MRLHDRLALRARVAGHKAEHFAAAAQRNANAFWFYLIVAGVVWRLVSWKWALLPAVLAAWSALNSVSATMIRSRLEMIEEG